MPVSNLTALCFAMGHQGGTVHQVARDLGVDVSDIINANDARMDDLLRMAQAHGRKVPADRAAALKNIAIVRRMISTDRHSASDYEAAWKALDRIQAALMRGGAAKWQPIESAPKDRHVLLIGGFYDTDDQSDGMAVDKDVVHQAIHLVGDVWNTPYGYSIRKPTNWMHVKPPREGE